MYKNVILFTASLLCMSLMFSCSSNAKQENKVKDAPVQEAKLVGNDRDEHGCIASAGYQWSELLKDCIRPFEKGIRMYATNEDESSFAAYLVFNADSSQVELFLPKEEQRPILTRETNAENGMLWINKESDGVSVKKEGQIWNIYLNSQPAFVSQTEDPKPNK